MSVVEIELVTIGSGTDRWMHGSRGGSQGSFRCEREAGFHIIGAWVDRQNDRFVWLIGYAGADESESANNRYYDSDERASLQPNPAELIEQAKAVKVETVV